MAGILDEYDEATPMRGTYCSRLTTDEYENQSSRCTEDALEQLISHLEGNPDVYKKVLKAKKKQEEEEAGILSFMRVKLWSFLSGGAGEAVVSNAECAEKIDNLKKNMLKVYDYSQESKGRRFSRRLAEKRLRKEDQDRTSTPHRGRENIPLPPPLPSFPSMTPRAVPSCCATPIVHATLTRRPLTQRQVKQADKITRCSKNNSLKDLMKQLNGSDGKRRLKRTAMRSPGGTPVEGWPKRHRDPDLLPYFNAKLLTKFKSTQSPVASPTFSLASPGSFETPPPVAKMVLSPDADGGISDTQEKEDMEIKDQMEDKKNVSEEREDKIMSDDPLQQKKSV